jgi:hypothetical protein
MYFKIRRALHYDVCPHTIACMQETLRTLNIWLIVQILQCLIFSFPHCLKKLEEREDFNVTRA